MSVRGHDDDFQGSFFAFEIDGVNLAWFTACSGMSIELDVTTYKEGDGSTIIERKRAGKPTYSEVTLKRGLTTDQALQEWFMEVAEPTGPTPYKNASIVVYDRAQAEGARFNLEQCWPSSLKVSDLSAGSDDVMVEEMTIQHEFIEWV